MNAIDLPSAVLHAYKEPVDYCSDTGSDKGEYRTEGYIEGRTLPAPKRS